MRRIASGLVALSVVFSAAVLVASPAGANGNGDCNVRDPTCTVSTGGGGNGGGSNGGGGGSSVDPCAKYPNAAYGDAPPKVSQACADDLQGNYCNAMKADAANALEKGYAQWTVAETDEVNREMAQIGCPPVVTPAGLAEQAFKTIDFPRPSGHRSPAEAEVYNGFAFTYVGLWTYYWTDPGTWKPLTATASAAGFTATVTAVPVSLSFDPGDGSDSSSCAGPGRPWTDADGNSAPGGGACGYQYSKVTGPGYDHPITSTQTILWKITWTGTGNSAGQIPALSTSTSGLLNVLQIKTVSR
jgi:hypothetical protein